MWQFHCVSHLYKLDLMQKWVLEEEKDRQGDGAGLERRGEKGNIIMIHIEGLGEIKVLRNYIFWKDKDGTEKNFC